MRPEVRMPTTPRHREDGGETELANLVLACRPIVRFPLYVSSSVH
jgi:hypothetical protein